MVFRLWSFSQLKSGFQDFARRTHEEKTSPQFPQKNFHIFVFLYIWTGESIGIDLASGSPTFSEKGDLVKWFTAAPIFSEK